MAGKGGLPVHCREPSMAGFIMVVDWVEQSETETTKERDYID